jgi:hypothetical protein
MMDSVALIARVILRSNDHISLGLYQFTDLTFCSSTQSHIISDHHSRARWEEFWLLSVLSRHILDIMVPVPLHDISNDIPSRPFAPVDPEMFDFIIPDSAVDTIGEATPNSTIRNRVLLDGIVSCDFISKCVLSSR